MNNPCDITLLLGSNLGDREANLKEAQRRLDAILCSAAKAQTPAIRTEAIGFEGPFFLNKALRYSCTLSPEELLAACKSIERDMGRTGQPEYDAQGKRVYHDRIIDIDILYYADLKLDTPELTIPHPQINTRPFVAELLKSLSGKKKVAVIAGAGPAGLTAALELLRQTDVKPVVLEASDSVGGISRTVNRNGNRMDIGGHRFFSKDDSVTRWWNEMMPVQKHPELNPDGPDPEKTDRVMLVRPRISRIFFLRKFFDYPLSLKFETFRNMGFVRVVRAAAGYLASTLHKLPEDSLENFYINRFGRPLYEMFFEGYTEKVWGVHPSKLGADWGSQRVKGLSVGAVLADMLKKALGRKKAGAKVETSLIEQFIYPKFGPGQLWETVRDELVKAGGEVLMNREVIAVSVGAEGVSSVRVKTPDGGEESYDCDYFLSTMPLKDLVASIEGVKVPEDVRKAALTLPYRDFITVGLCLKKMLIDVPDTWIYIQERDVNIGRLQVFNNWSPYLVADGKNTVWIGLEYFCTEGDRLWSMEDGEFIEMAVKELERIGLIDSEDVLDSCRIKVKKAYPAYYGSYSEIGKIRGFLDGIENLFCLGRNGQHRYNNMDHSMLTAFECVKLIKSGNIHDKSGVWNVNTEAEYHESK